MLALFFLSCTPNKNADTADTTPSPLDALVSCEGIEPLVSLPADEAYHSDPIEWWYWTGHLQDENDTWYGFEQVFFLMQLGSIKYTMGHHAITRDEEFKYNVEFAEISEIPEMSNAFSWEMDGFSVSGGSGSDVIHGELDNSTLDLTITDTMGPINQHCSGYTEYDFGGFTYYYSRPRMEASGTLVLDGEEHTVNGTAWFDHQWGDLTAATTAGWDWFAIQLDDNRSIMLFEVRADSGGGLVGGTYIDENGTQFEIPEDAYSITPTGQWSSEESGCEYPMGWDIEVVGINLTITPIREDQELVNRSNTYWEGNAAVSGDVNGRAYIEMTGYCN